MCGRIRELAAIKGDLTPEDESKLADFVWRRRDDRDRLFEGLGHMIRLALEVECRFERPLDHVGARLRHLIGLPVTDIRHPLPQVFEFGQQVERAAKYREECSRGEWQLTIWTSWSLLKGDEVVFGSDDHRTRRRFYDRETPPRDPEARRRWQRARTFYEEFAAPGLSVRECHLGPGGTLRIDLTEEYSIVVLPTASSEDDECWSLWNTRHDVRYAVWPERLEVTLTRMKPSDRD